MIREMLQAHRPGRLQRRLAYRDFLFLNCGQTSVNLHLLCLDGRSPEGGCRRRDESASAIVRTAGGIVADTVIARKGSLVRNCLVIRSCLFPEGPVAYRSFAASVETVEARYAAAVIYHVFLHVYAGCLAMSAAKPAVPAFFSVDDRPEYGKARKKPQNGADRTYGVAPCAAVLPRQNEDDYERDDSYDENRQALEPYFGAVERIAVNPSCDPCQKIVPPTTRAGRKG